MLVIIHQIPPLTKKEMMGENSVEQIITWVETHFRSLRKRIYRLPLLTFQILPIKFAPLV